MNPGESDWTSAFFAVLDVTILLILVVPTYVTAGLSLSLIVAGIVVVLFAWMTHGPPSCFAEGRWTRETRIK